MPDMMITGKTCRKGTAGFCFKMLFTCILIRRHYGNNPDLYARGYQLACCKSNRRKLLNRCDSNTGKITERACFAK